MRWALLFPPSALISVRSRFHVSLVKLGGGPGRNWSPLAITQGFRLPQWGTFPTWLLLSHFAHVERPARAG